jgi:hypothetical protein
VDEYAQALYESVTAAVPGWIEESTLRLLSEGDREPTGNVMTAITAAGLAAQAEVDAELKVLLAADIDEQQTTPLAVVRKAIRHATGVLAAAAIPPVERDETQRRLFPDDIYDLTPATFGDVDPSLTEPALIWGAHKAMAHLQRHGSP